MEIDIEQYVKQQIDEMDLSDYVQRIIRSLITKEIQEEIKKTVNTLIVSFIKAEFDIILKQPITIKNGWDSDKKYDSFEDFVKQSFKEILLSNNRLNDTLKNACRDIAQKIYNDQEALLKESFLEFAKQFKLQK